jgi:cell division cycle 14
LPYRDAGYGAATYHITILDCLKGLHKALHMGLVDLESIDPDEYEFYEKVENGDLNWITDKFIAMACPKDDIPNLHQYHLQRSSTGVIIGPQKKVLFPAYRMDDLITHLEKKGVTTVIRLNNKTYDKTKFVNAGMEHIEMYFPDGTTPPEGILKRFLELCESKAGKT